MPCRCATALTLHQHHATTTTETGELERDEETNRKNEPYIIVLAAARSYIPNVFLCYASSLHPGHRHTSPLHALEYPSPVYTLTV